MANRADPNGHDEANRNRQWTATGSTLLRSSHAVSRIWPCEVCRAIHGARKRPVLFYSVVRHCTSRWKARTWPPVHSFDRAGSRGSIADAIPPDLIAVSVPKLLPHKPARRLLHNDGRRPITIGRLIIYRRRRRRRINRRASQRPSDQRTPDQAASNTGSNLAVLRFRRRSA